MVDILFLRAREEAKYYVEVSEDVGKKQRGAWRLAQLCFLAQQWQAWLVETMMVLAGRGLYRRRGRWRFPRDYRANGRMVLFQRCKNAVDELR